MKHRISIIIGILLLSATVIPSANSAVKAGASCTKVGATSTASGRKFTCVKIGKKLAWNSGVLIAPVENPTKSQPAIATTPAPSIVPIVSPESDFASTADCKLGKPSNLPMDDGPMGSVGFPMNPNEFASTGNLKGLVILTDFSDAVGTSEMREVWTNSTIPLAEKLFPYSSYGKLNLKIDLSTKTYRMQKPSTYYNLVASPSGGPIENGPEPKLDEVILDGMRAADADYDFNQYAFVTVAAPRSSTLILSGATGLGRIPTSFDGKTFVQGDFVPLDANTPIDKPYKTLNFTHDIGHMLGLMHPYVSAAPTHGAWDIMWSFAFQNDFLGWNKWKLNWITNDQIACVTPDSNAATIQLLSPIGVKNTEKKLVVIKLSATQALAVEVRRKSPFEDLKTSDEGVLVYKVDTTKGSGAGPHTIVSNPRKVLVYQNFEAVLGTMKPGESITESGYTISVLQSVANGDYVSVKKSS